MTTWLPFMAGIALALAMLALCTYAMILNRWPWQQHHPTVWLTFSCSRCDRRFESIQQLYHHETVDHEV